MWKISQSEFEEILGVATVQVDLKIVRVNNVFSGNTNELAIYPGIPTRKKSRALQLPVSLLWSKKRNQESPTMQLNSGVLLNNSHTHTQIHKKRDQPHPTSTYSPQTDVEGTWLEQPRARNGHHWLIVANALIAYIVGPNPWRLASNNASLPEVQKGQACLRAE